MKEENQESSGSVSPEAGEQPVESSGRRNFMKAVVAGAVVTGGLAAVSSAQSAPTCGPFPTEDLKQLTSIIQAYGGRLVDYFPCGQPDPNAVFGTVSIRPDGAGALIQAFLKFDRIRLNCEVFPLGIPYPDLVNIKFKTPGVGGY